MRQLFHLCGGEFPSLQSRAMSGELRIRAFDPKQDLERFTALNYRTFWDSIPAEEKIPEEKFKTIHIDLIKRYAPEDTNRSVVIVAEKPGEPYLGHCWLSLQNDFFTQQPQPWILDLSVRPEFRGQGIGKALLDECVHRCKVLGFRSIGLQVLSHNEGAFRFYEREGFTIKAHSMILKSP